MWSGYSSTSLYGQTSIWLPKVDRTPTHITYTYNIQAPDYLAQWIQTLPQPGNVVQKTINGKLFSFVERYLVWDNGGSSPSISGQIRLDAIPNNDPNGKWRSDEKLKVATDVIQALNSAASPSDGLWKSAHIFALKWEGGTPPQLTFTEEIPKLEQAKTRMAEFAKNTSPGKFYPEVNVPTDLVGYRAAMLEIVNLGRRDPDYRTKNRNAPDLRAEYAQVDGGFEKIYRNNTQPPLFKDLALDDRLNDAAQLQAEWAAKQKYMGHDGPGNYKGINMTSLDQRAVHFAPNYGGIVEAGGGNDAPESWMKSETHFRPWFNILHDVGYLGFGVAIGGDGQMRAFAVPASTRPHNTNENSTSYTFQLPIRPGAAIEREKKYPSVDGRTCLKLQEDGNLAIFYDRNRSKRNENTQDEYLWGLAESEHKIDSRKVSKVQISTAGQLEVVGKDGTILWTASSTKPNFDKNGLSEEPVVLCAGAINGNNSSNPSGGTVDNIAKGKATTQSSEAYNCPASKAVDGNTSGTWDFGKTITHTKEDGNNPWWEVDLGGVFDISEIKIWNRTDDCCWNRLKIFYVMVSEDPITANSTSLFQFTTGAQSFASASNPSMTLTGNKKGRYVRVFIPGDKKVLSLAEVEVKGIPVAATPQSWVSVAKGKTATQSSEAYNCPASKAVDGNSSGIWDFGKTITHTKEDGNNPWWEVDLGGVFDISEIKIWNRTDDCCWSRLQNFYVMVSEGPITENSTDLFQFAAGAKSFGSASYPSMTIAGNKKGRFVRVFIPGDKKVLSLAEVEVKGTPAR